MLLLVVEPGSGDACASIIVIMIMMIMMIMIIVIIMMIMTIMMTMMMMVIVMQVTAGTKAARRVKPGPIRADSRYRPSRI